MSRSHHANLERAESAVLPLRYGLRAQRRAALEGALAAAIAEGDAETASHLRDELELLSRGAR